MADVVVKNPCVGVCTINTKLDICPGCYRNCMEKAQWNCYTNEVKKQTIVLCDLRRKAWPKLQSGWVNPVEGI